MRKIFLFAIIIASLSAQAQNRFLVAGTKLDKLAIINKDNHEIEWQYRGDAGECEYCNSVVYLKGGNVAYAYRNGAKMISPQGDIIFEYKPQQGEKVQSISQIKDGFMIGLCGSPMRIVELNSKGEPIKELTFDTKVKSMYKQFRQIAKTKKGTYVIPIGGANRIVELSASGELLKDIKLDNSFMYVTITKKGDWLITGGHSGLICQIDSKSGELTTIVDGPELGDGVRIEFAAGISELKNGNYMLANWVGHDGDQSQPILVELDKQGRVVWKMNKIEGVTYVATACPVYD